MNSYAYQIAKTFLRQRNREHLGRYPQLACFAFDAITLSVHLDGRYERDELNFLAERIFPQLPRDSACLDIGANIGNHSLHFAGHFAKVIALEPHPRTYRLLSLNAELADNVVTLQVGASSEPATIEVVENSSNMGASSIHHDSGTPGCRVAFPLARVDDLPEIQGCERIAFIKIDVEGHEAEALRGAAATIARHRPLIAIEVLASELRDGDSEALGVLRGLGYQHFYEIGEGGWAANLPRRAVKILRALGGLLSGRRLSRKKRLKAVARFEPRNYPMVICAPRPLPAD